MDKKILMDQRGTTLVEVLIAVLIGAIAFYAIAVPFYTERSFTVAGRRQAEAQRQAHLIFRSMSLMARESESYSIDATSGRLTFTRACGSAYFEKDNNGKFDFHDGCSANPERELIDGTLTKVVDFTSTPVSPNLVRVNLEVLHKNQRTEKLQTQIFLRNVS
jgi:Tfp pilus assembly protein PilV